MSSGKETDDNENIKILAEKNKELGNNLFKEGKFIEAIEKFTEANKLDPSNDIYLVNRSICYAHLKNWEYSAKDAKSAIKISSRNNKAHFRLVKALVQLEKFKEARLSLSYAFKECGEHKEFKVLENEIFNLTGILLRPKPTDFEILEEIGDGNFSQVFKTRNKSTSQIFAIKTMEKMKVEKMRKRHPNINNEIMMEKRVLNKLSHPGIVELFTTFQDYGTLYFQMEYISGKCLWDMLHEDVILSDSQPFLQPTEEEIEGIKIKAKLPHKQVGLHWSLIKFYLAEAINVLEHMHRRGIVHRDIKPENIMINGDGHLKFIDFGTSKDLIQSDLNGPEFVGTPEYMSPSVVKSSKDVSIETDLWALGCLLYQMVMGTTPFNAPSPYLTFLRIKRGKVLLPDWLPSEISSLINSLLDPNPFTRLSNSSNLNDLNLEELPSLSYDKLREHPFFSDLRSATLKDAIPVSQSEFIKDLYKIPTQRVPTLRELCIREVGKAAVKLSDLISLNGGTRPSISWAKTFDLFRLHSLDRQRIGQYLKRHQKLHFPVIYRFFCQNVIEARTKRAIYSTEDYVGLTYDIQGHWDRDFYFSSICNPLIGAQSAIFSKPNDSLDSLKSLISTINKLRPKFCVIIGNFTSIECPILSQEEVNLKQNSEVEEWHSYDFQINQFLKAAARISESIPSIFVPGKKDVGEHPTKFSLQRYRERFGADFFAFWLSGMRGVVINSSLMISPNSAPEEALRQETFLEEEIEQSKLCSTSMMIFSYHPWFYSDFEEEDYFPVDDSTPFERNFPKTLRHKWLNKMRHHKIKFVFSSISQIPPASYNIDVDRPLRPFRKSTRPFWENKASPDDKNIHSESARVENNGGNENDSVITEELEEAMSSDGDESDFVNEELDYLGPEMLLNFSSIHGDLSCHTENDPRSDAIDTSTPIETTDIRAPGIQVVFVKEEEAFHKFYNRKSIPKSVKDLSSDLKSLELN